LPDFVERLKGLLDHTRLQRVRGVLSPALNLYAGSSRLGLATSTKLYWRGNEISPGGTSSGLAPDFSPGKGATRGINLA
jgi:hypothetical protein